MGTDEYREFRNVEDDYNLLVTGIYCNIIKMIVHKINSIR